MHLQRTSSKLCGINILSDMFREYFTYVGKYEKHKCNGHVSGENCTLSASASDITSTRTKNTRTSAGARRF